MRHDERHEASEAMVEGIRDEIMTRHESENLVAFHNDERDEWVHDRASEAVREYCLNDMQADYLRDLLRDSLDSFGVGLAVAA